MLRLLVPLLLLLPSLLSLFWSFMSRCSLWLWSICRSFRLVSIRITIVASAATHKWNPETTLCTPGYSKRCKSETSCFAAPTDTRPRSLHTWLRGFRKQTLNSDRGSAISSPEGDNEQLHFAASIHTQVICATCVRRQTVVLLLLLLAMMWMMTQ